MKIITRFLREQKRYTKKDLAFIFEFDESGIERFIRTLKAYHILKTVRNNAEQREMTDLVDEDVQIADETADNEQYLYVFVYVGVITIGRRILKIYPKYIFSKSEPVDEMRQVLKVLEKYSKAEEQIVNLYNGDGDDRNFNLLAVILFLLKDYYEYGIYNNLEDIVEINGGGEVLWEKTINETFTIIRDNRPYYMEMFTRKSEDDEDNYFRRLHAAVLNECSKLLADAQLVDLFGMEEVNLTEDRIDDLGEREYILDRIIGELSAQFNTRKQILLKTIYTYISQDKKMFEENQGISMYGTSSFNLVWEKVSASVFNNKLQSQLGTLALPCELSTEYNPKDKLIDIIEKPQWIGDGFVKTAKDTLIPDLITFNLHEADSQFVILDAKYYNLQMTEDKMLRGQPGIESITKQYLYQLAYREFIERHGFSSVRNCFILPTEKDEIEVIGTAKLAMLSNLGLEDIQVRLIPAELLFSHYLGKKRIPVEKLKL